MDIRCVKGGSRTTDAIRIGNEGEGDQPCCVQGTSYGSILVWKERQGECSVQQHDIHVNNAEVTPIQHIAWNRAFSVLAASQNHLLSLCHICVKSIHKSKLLNNVHIEHSVLAMDWIDNLKMLVTTDEANRIVAYSADLSSKLMEVVSPSKPKKLAVGENLHEIATGNDSNEVYLWSFDQQSNAKVTPITLKHPTTVLNFLFIHRKDSCLLVASCADKNVYIWYRNYQVPHKEFYLSDTIVQDVQIESMKCISTRNSMSDMLALPSYLLLLCRATGGALVHCFVIIYLVPNGIPFILQIEKSLLKNVNISSDISTLIARGAHGKDHVLSSADTDVKSADKQSLLLSQENQNICSPIGISNVEHFIANSNKVGEIILIRYFRKRHMLLCYDANNKITCWDYVDHKLKVLTEFISKESLVDIIPLKNSQEIAQSHFFIVLLGISGHHIMHINNGNQFEMEVCPLESTCLADCYIFGGIQDKLGECCIYCADRNNSFVQFTFKVNSGIEYELQAERRHFESNLLDITKSYSNVTFHRVVGHAYCEESCFPAMTFMSSPDKSYFLSWDRQKLVMHELDNWDNSLKIKSLKVAQSLEYIILHVEFMHKSELQCWKKSQEKNSFCMHSTLELSTSDATFDMIDMPCLCPMILLYEEGSTYICIYKPFGSSWISARTCALKFPSVTSIIFIDLSSFLILSSNCLFVIDFGTLNDAMKWQDGFNGGDIKLQTVRELVHRAYGTFQILNNDLCYEWFLQGRCSFITNIYTFIHEYLEIVKLGQLSVKSAEKVKRDVLEIFNSMLLQDEHEGHDHLDTDLGKFSLQPPTKIQGKVKQVWYSISKSYRKIKSEYHLYSRLDFAGQRFVRSLYFSRSMNEFPTHEEQPNSSLLSDTDAEFIWAYLSKDKDTIHEICIELIENTTWECLRKVGVGFWIDSQPVAIASLEKVAKAEFLKRRDPHDCALYYIALRKVNILAGLCKATSNTKLFEFLKRDFEEEKNKVAALKNGYALLGKHRYALAAAFFLLSGRFEDAIDICINHMNDIQLGLCLGRVLSNGVVDLYEYAIQNVLMEKATQMDDVFALSIFNLMKKDYKAAFNSFSNVFTRSQNLSQKCSQSSYHRCHMVVELFCYCCSNFSGLENSMQLIESSVEYMSSCGDTVTPYFLLNLYFSNQGKDLGTMSKAQKIVNQINICVLPCVLLLSWLGCISTNFSGNKTFNELRNALLSNTTKTTNFVRDCDVSIEDPVSLFEAMGIFNHCSALKDVKDLESTVNADDQCKSKGGPISDSDLHLNAKRCWQLIALYQNKNVMIKTSAFNSCNCLDTVLSTEKGLLSIQLEMLDDYAIFNKKERNLESSFDLQHQIYPYDSWSRARKWDGNIEMPQWAKLNISKSNVCATVLEPHPSRPLFFSNGHKDGSVLLWDFHQQSAMACYDQVVDQNTTMQQYLTKLSKIQCLSAHKAGFRFASLSNGCCSIFDISKIQVETSVSLHDYNSQHQAGGGDRYIDFLSSSTVLVLRERSFSIWDTLCKKGAMHIPLKDNQLKNIYLEGDSSCCSSFGGYFVVSDGNGFHLFDVRNVNKAIWSHKSRISDVSLFGYTLASLDENGVCKLWDLSSRTCLSTMDFEEDDVCSMQLCSKRTITIGKASSIKVYYF